jgi:hypothetical protein
MLQSSYDRINHAIISHNNSLVYIGIGSSMKRYNLIGSITEQNNQQYPIFLNKFNNHKVIILIDPDLEDDLKIPELKEIEVINEISKLRILQNKTCTIFAFYEYYNYDDLSFIHNIISIVLNANIKLIVQDYTGRDIISIYDNLIPIFGKEVLLPNVLFDVTALNGECFVNFSSEDCSMIDGTFVNEKFKKLINLSHNTISKRIFKERIKVVINEISWIYINKIKNPEFEYNFPKKVYYLFHTYDIQYSESNIIESFSQLINALVRDIVQFQNCTPDIAEYIISNIHERSIFLNNMCILDFE